MTFKTYAAALAAASLPALAGAAPPKGAPAACLTREEAQTVISFVLPDLVAGVAAQCTPVAGPASYLARTPGLTARYAAQSRPLSPAVRSALVARFKIPASVAQLQDDTLRDLLRGVLTEQMKKMTPKVCGQIDEVMATLDPLPPANVARAVVLFVDFTTKPNEPRRICPQ